MVTQIGRSISRQNELLPKKYTSNSIWPVVSVKQVSLPAMQLACLDSEVNCDAACAAPSPTDRALNSASYLCCVLVAASRCSGRSGVLQGKVKEKCTFSPKMSLKGNNKICLCNCFADIPCGDCARRVCMAGLVMSGPFIKPLFPGAVGFTAAFMKRLGGGNRPPPLLLNDCKINSFKKFQANLIGIKSSQKFFFSFLLATQLNGLSVSLNGRCTHTYVYHHQPVEYFVRPLSWNAICHSDCVGIQDVPVYFLLRLFRFRSRREFHNCKSLTFTPCSQLKETTWFRKRPQNFGCGVFGLGSEVRKRSWIVLTRKKVGVWILLRIPFSSASLL